MGDPCADPQQMQETARRMLETFVQAEDARGLALAGRSLGLALRRAGRVAECCAVLERALAHADASADEDARRQVSGTLACALCDGPATVDEAIQRCEQLIESGRRGGVLEAAVTRSLAALHAMAGRFDESRDLVRRSSAVLDRLNQSDVSWAYLILVADAMQLAGDRARAERELLAMWRRFDEIPDFPVDARAMHAAYQLALLYCDDGRWGEAERCVEFGSEVPIPEYFLNEAVLGLAARARLSARRGVYKRALARAQRALDLGEQTDMSNLRARLWLAVAEVQRATGDDNGAAAALAEAIRLHEAKGNIAAIARLRATHH
jgi:tetratricopeptide (TPR) repeat protein